MQPMFYLFVCPSWQWGREKDYEEETHYMYAFFLILRVSRRWLLIGKFKAPDSRNTVSTFRLYLCSTGGRDHGVTIAEFYCISIAFHNSNLLSILSYR